MSRDPVPSPPFHHHPWGGLVGLAQSLARIEVPISCSSAIWLEYIYIKIPLWYETSAWLLCISNSDRPITNDSMDGHTFMLDKEPGPSSGYFASRNSMTSAPSFSFLFRIPLGGNNTHEDPRLHYLASCSFRGSSSHEADYSYSVR